VTLESNVTVDQLTLDTTLSQTAGTLQVGQFNLQGGTYLLNGGTLANSTLNVGRGSLGAESGTFDNVSVTGNDLQVYSSDFVSTLLVRNGLTISSGHQLILGGYYFNSNLIFDGASQQFSSSIDSVYSTWNDLASVIDVGGPDSSGPVSLTLSSQAVVHGAISFNNGTNGDSLINSGTINADVGGGYPAPNAGLFISVPNFTNLGVVEATNGGVLSLNSAVWNNLPGGVIEAAQYGTVNLGSTFTTSQMGSLSAEATATINIAGTLNNTAATWAIPATGNFQLFGGTIIGGTIDESAGNPLIIQGGVLRASKNGPCFA